MAHRFRDSGQQYGILSNCLSLVRCVLCYQEQCEYQSFLADLDGMWGVDNCAENVLSKLEREFQEV
jgi:hypothetical protein